MIKIFGGVAKGFTLKAPPNLKTRPTSVLLRRKFFDSMQDLSGYNFADICAGSGSVGLEAASRGAGTVHFVENYRPMVNVLKKNISEFSKKYSSLGNLICTPNDFKNWFEKTVFDFEKQDWVIFFDPPYEKLELYSLFFECLEKIDYKGLVVVEACQQKSMTQDEFEKRFGSFKKSYRQGSSYFVVYEF